MKIISTTGASTVVHPVHGTVTADADGSFDVSPELAADLLAFPHWTTEEAHLAEVEHIDLVELADPLHAVEVLALLREDRAVLRAGGTLEPASTEPAPWSPDPVTVAWVAMHLRGDAAGIAELTSIATEIHALQLRAAQAAAADAPVAAEKTTDGAK